MKNKSRDTVLMTTQPNGHVPALKSTKDVRSDLDWALNKTYTARFDIRHTRFCGHVQALKSTKT